MDQPGYFLNPTRMDTCAAICARLVPTGANPATDPGATEARAAVFIDRFLAAFELPQAVPDNPGIWLNGRYSGRNPYPDPATGEPSSTSPPDELLNSSGLGNFVSLTRIQVLSWRAQLHGVSELQAAALQDAQLAGWAKLVEAGTIPGVLPGGLRKLYADGLDAFDSYSKHFTGQPFTSANPTEQDVMLALAGNIVLDALGLPLPAVAVVPPPAAEALFPTLLSHTFQACYGIPEYRGVEENPLWTLIGYDGDTQPLGNTIYDANLEGAGPGEGPNAGFGEENVYVPAGGYHEFRPVSYPAPGSNPLGATDAERAVKFLGSVGKPR